METHALPPEGMPPPKVEFTQSSHSITYWSIMFRQQGLPLSIYVQRKETLQWIIYYFFLLLQISTTTTFYSFYFIAYSINLSRSFSSWILAVPKQQRLHLSIQHTYICTANTSSQTLSHLGQHNLCCWCAGKGKCGLSVHGVWQMNQIYEPDWQRHRHTLPSPTGFRRKVGQTDVGQSSILESTRVKFGWDHL